MIVPIAGVALAASRVATSAALVATQAAAFRVALPPPARVPSPLPPIIARPTAFDTLAAFSGPPAEADWSAAMVAADQDRRWKP